ncbi:MAG: DUF1573 domain-containing protein [Actinobacteria bacterium]|nr:DUF1573 domain-containing protein [Actinomycetota bacterium]
MAAKERSFWSSIPGLLTGLAGVLTGVVGLLGLAFNQGWLGDGPTGGEGASAGAEVVRISVDPKSLSFEKGPAGADTETVTVTNDGTEPVTISTTVTGEDEDTFEAQDGDCTRSQIPSGASCSVEVVFDAGAGRYEAMLVVSANDDEQRQQVELTATSAGLLG